MLFDCFRLQWKVRGIHVPQPTQYYALVVSGPFDPSRVQVGASCNAAANFAINATRFEEATEEDHFPLGPVLGGALGGLGFLAIIAALIRFCYKKYMTGQVI